MKYTIKYTREQDGVYARAYDEAGYIALGSGKTKEEARENLIERMKPVEDLGSEEVETPEAQDGPDEKQTEIEQANPSLTSNPFSL